MSVIFNKAAGWNWRKKNLPKLENYKELSSKGRKRHCYRQKKRQRPRKQGATESQVAGHGTRQKMLLQGLSKTLSNFYFKKITFCQLKIQHI